MRITLQIPSLASQQSILFFIKWSDYFSLLFPFVTSKWLPPLNLSEKALLSESWWSVISIDCEFHFPWSYYIDIDKKSLHFSTFHLRFICLLSFHQLRHINIISTNYFIFSLFITFHHALFPAFFTFHHLYQVQVQTHYIIPTRHFFTSYSSLHFISSFP